MKNRSNLWVRILLCAASLAATAWLLCLLPFTGAIIEIPETVEESLGLMDRFDEQMAEPFSSARDAALSVKKIYWIPEGASAPEPNAAYYGTTDDPSTLQWLLDEAAELLDGQELYFSTETQLVPGYKVTYYLDDTILAISWKEPINYYAYTICEVKVADASQFRRYLAGGEYGSSVRKTTTELAADVNAVVACAGDFYTYRQIGITAYEGEVMRFTRERLDTCFVDRDGNLVMVHGGDLASKEETQKFIDENNISFGVTFGPILVENGERCEPSSYILGEIDDHYSRAGIGQKGELHYIMVTVNEEYFESVPTLHELAAGVMRFGCDSFYTLDGGHTATIAMNGKTMNRPDWGYQRTVSDILYFATALPNSGGNTDPEA